MVIHGEVAWSNLAVAMTAWTSDVFRRNKNEGSPGNKMIAHNQASCPHHSGTTMELEERVTSQAEEERTETSTERAQYATESPTDAIKTSHLKRLPIWWSHNVRFNLEQDAPGGNPRDYLALERTFLAWFRMSLALISFGVVITQLFVLKDVDPKKGKILGATMSGGGIIVLLLGCVRYFEQQSLLTKGKALSGGWHHQLLMIVLLLILITLFVIVIVDS